MAMYFTGGQDGQWVDDGAGAQPASWMQGARGDLSRSGGSYFDKATNRYYAQANTSGYSPSGAAFFGYDPIEGAKGYDDYVGKAKYLYDGQGNQIGQETFSPRESMAKTAAMYAAILGTGAVAGGALAGYGIPGITGGAGAGTGVVGGEALTGSALDAALQSASAEAMAAYGGAGAAEAAQAAGIASMTGAATPALAPVAEGGFWSSVTGGLGKGAAAVGSAIGSAASSLGSGGVGSLVGPAASVIGGLYGAKAADKASDAQVAATDRATDISRGMFDKQVELQEPFRQGGISGMNKLLFGLGLSGDPNAPGYGAEARDFSMADFNADPGYAFRKAEGAKAVENSGAARGMQLSGAGMKALNRYGQDFASNEYSNAYNRFQTNRAARLNPLQSLMGAGQSSANTLTGAAGQYGQQASENAIGAGNARASGIVGGINALNSGIGQGYNMYQTNQLTNRYLDNQAQQNSLLNMIRKPGEY